LILSKGNLLGIINDGGLQQAWFPVPLCVVIEIRNFFSNGKG